MDLLGDTTNDGLFHKNAIWSLLALIWWHRAIVNKGFCWRRATHDEEPSAVDWVAVNSFRWLWEREGGIHQPLTIGSVHSSLWFCKETGSISSWATKKTWDILLMRSSSALFGISNAVGSVPNVCYGQTDPFQSSSLIFLVVLVNFWFCCAYTHSHTCTHTLFTSLPLCPSLSSSSLPAYLCVGWLMTLCQMTCPLCVCVCARVHVFVGQV